eukprot:TRINITY_DN2915_c0_g1_i4.p1 TRINITY_DN2915_c0_g1~~TRINITY_DN2915_c0_g1_i4.p1  ORF type:complete len:937 (+),score=160.53 TRINITY_DN2915_c0_g1_i4:7074-9884(+)
MVTTLFPATTTHRNGLQEDMMPVPSEKQLPQPKSTTVLRRDPSTSGSLSPNNVLPTIRSPSVGKSSPQLTEIKLGPLRQELQALKSVVETDRKKAAAQQHVISQLEGLAQLGGTEALLKRIAQLELDNAKLRAATLLPPSPSPAANRSDYTISPAKILLERPRIATPPPDRSPSRVLDMGAPLSPDTPDFRHNGGPPAHPSMLPRPRTPTSISPSSAPPPPPPPLPVPTRSVLERDPLRMASAARSPEYLGLPLPESEEAPETHRTSTSPVDIIDFDSDTGRKGEGGHEDRAAIGSILSKMFGGANVTLVETGVVTSNTVVASYPTMQQPLLIEEKWVPRGMYPVMKLGDIVRPGVPVPNVGATQFEILLESGNLYKYESGGFLGLYNCSPDKQFTLSFVIMSPSVIPVGDTRKIGNTYIIKLEPGEAKAFVRGAVDGYKVTVQYARPGSNFLKNRVEQQDLELLGPKGSPLECAERGVPYVDPAFPPSSESLCRRWEGTTTRRCWLRLEDVYNDGDTAAGLFVVPVQPNTIRLVNLCDIHYTSALAILAENPLLVKRMFINSPEEAAGAYKLRVYSSIKEADITVDAFFPFLGYSLAFASHLTHPHELWIPLANKAYAKLKGSYVAARSGTVPEVLRVFTGLPVDTIGVAALPAGDHEAVFQKLQAACNAGNVCGLVMPRDASLDSKQRASGLLGGCGYAVTRVEKVHSKMLVQLRNPWMSPRMWGGRWGHSSMHWDEHPEAVSQLNMAFEDDGCMWLEMDEVCAWFAEAVILNNKPWGRMCVGMQMSEGAPDCVLQVDVERSTRVHVSALVQTDARVNTWRSVNVSAVTKAEGKWLVLQDTWLDMVPGVYWFVVTDKAAEGDTHLILHSLCPLGKATLLRPSSSLLQVLHKGCAQFSLPSECSPVESDCPVSCHIQTSSADTQPTTTTASSIRF